LFFATFRVAVVLLPSPLFRPLFFCLYFASQFRRGRQNCFQLSPNSTAAELPSFATLRGAMIFSAFGHPVQVAL
jgi:hypothetical protein